MGRKWPTYHGDPSIFSYLAISKQIEFRNKIDAYFYHRSEMFLSLQRGCDEFKDKIDKIKKLIMKLVWPTQLIKSDKVHEFTI